MITFKISGQRFPVPTQWAEVTYSQYVYHIIPRSFAETIHCFTGLPIQTLETAEIRGLDRMSIALAFMSVPPKFELTPMIGPYVMPVDITFESVGQFEDLRGLSRKLPAKKIAEYEYADWEQYCDLCLEASAIYCQKVRDSKYDYRKVAEIKESLKSAPCTETIGCGTFFLSRPMNISLPTVSLYQKALRLLRRWIQALPGYQKTLDFLLRSSR